MTLQVKETGTPVDFTKAREISMQMYTFQDDVFGIYAYQNAPVTVNSAVRDAFLNGNLDELLNQAAGQGMQIQYTRITWNETAQGNNYYITDLAVGVVAKATREWNTGPAYLIEALNAVSWFNQLISKVYMPWKAWLLLTSLHDLSYYTWDWEAVSEEWSKFTNIWEPLPDLPSTLEVQSHFVNDGKIDEGLAKFLRGMIDGGYTTTLLGAGYRTQVCYQRSQEIVAIYTHGYRYRTHTRLSVDFTTDPAIMASPLAPIVAALIVKLIAIIVAGVVVYALLKDLFTESTTVTDHFKQTFDNPTDQPVTYTLPDGTKVTIPPHGTYTYEGTHTESTTGPPDWWGNVLTIIGVVGIIVVAVVVVPKLIPKRKEKES